jgi:fructose-specific component phosphotransferase system IIB-like protein
MLDLGIVRPGTTIRIPFSTFDKDTGASITMTDYAAADILVFKGGSTTERASTAGYTATTDFDTLTGKHLAVIDLSDNTDAGFWAAGGEYLVAINAVTVDAVSTGGWIARFLIGYREALYNTTISSVNSQTSIVLTAGPAEDDALNGRQLILHDVASAVQWSTVIVSDYTGASKTCTLAAAPTFTVAATDNVAVMGPAPLQPATAGSTLTVTSGRANADVTHLNGSTANLLKQIAALSTMVTGTVDTGSFTATTTAFESDDVTEATTSHYVGRNVLFIAPSALAGQAARITAYELSGANGKFTVTAMTEAPANNDTFVIV